MLLFCLHLNAGTGKGGTSIWGRKFEDEFSEHLKVSWQNAKIASVWRNHMFTVPCFCIFLSSTMSGGWWPWQIMDLIPTLHSSISPTPNSLTWTWNTQCLESMSLSFCWIHYTTVYRSLINYALLPQNNRWFRDSGWVGETPRSRKDVSAFEWGPH